MITRDITLKQNKDCQGCKSKYKIIKGTLERVMLLKTMRKQFQPNNLLVSA